MLGLDWHYMYSQDEPIMNDQVPGLVETVETSWSFVAVRFTNFNLSMNFVRSPRLRRTRKRNGHYCLNFSGLARRPLVTVTGGPRRATAGTESYSRHAGTGSDWLARTARTVTRYAPGSQLSVQSAVAADQHRVRQVTGWV